MSVSKRNPGIYLSSILITAAATALFAVLWLNNLVSAWRYHAMLFRRETMEALPAGITPALTWTAIDVSTVTTFIPFFGFLLLFLALLKIRNDETWPFFRTYDRLNIALGLIGTLWGIILIGFYPSNQVTIAALMSCLHTAMFSTLAAIIWVMVFEPLIFLPWMRAIRRARSEMPAEDASLEELANTLLASLNQAGTEMKAAGAASATFREELQKLNAELAVLATEVGKNRENEALWRENTLACVRDLAATAEGFKAHQEKLSAENAALTSRCDKLEKDLTASVQETNTLSSRCNTLEHDLTESTDKANKLTDRCDKLEKDLTASTSEATALTSRCDKLEKDLAESTDKATTLATRCGSLESELAASVKEATTLKRQLDAIREALR